MKMECFYMPLMIEKTEQITLFQFPKISRYFFSHSSQAGARARSFGVFHRFPNPSSYLNYYVFLWVQMSSLNFTQFLFVAAILVRGLQLRNLRKPLGTLSEPCDRMSSRKFKNFLGLPRPYNILGLNLLPAVRALQNKGHISI